MDAANEDFSRQDVDPEMTMLTAEEVTEQSADGGDEVENLRRRYFLNVSVWEPAIQNLENGFDWRNFWALCQTMFINISELANSKIIKDNLN